MVVVTDAPVGSFDTLAVVALVAADIDAALVAHFAVLLDALVVFAAVPLVEVVVAD